MISEQGSIDSGHTSWSCTLDNSNTYSSKAMATKIDNIILPRPNVGDATIRNNLIPQKIGIFVWRVLKGRIAVKQELAKRGIYLGNLSCPICNDTPESIDHALFSCKLAHEVWTGIHNWWKIIIPTSCDLKTLLVNTTYANLPSRL
ncbi:uncharacterized protein [Rutidosis leptorrhynchoides]|uniref:uncharacterized protein n=1 Tax=Rutidosis leptorrhynchoides TaxID=125765 RepID=UPI003A993A5B